MAVHIKNFFTAAKFQHYLSFFLQDRNTASSYPTLLYTGSSPLWSDSIKVVCEHVSVNVFDFTSGIALVCAMYWAYNLQYVKSAKQTFTVLEELMVVRKGACLSTLMPATKVVTTLRARAGTARE